MTFDLFCVKVNVPNTERRLRLQTEKNNIEKEKEQLFSALLLQSSKKGYINSDTILKRFARFHLDYIETENIILNFENAGIRVIFDEEMLDDFIDNISNDFNQSSNSNPVMDTASTGTFQEFLNKIHSYPTLTHKQNLKLVRMMNCGDTKAREKLINCNLKFAHMIAIKYANIGLPLPDLVQQAIIGLITAIDLYNPNRGTRLTTYSIFWIKQSILRYIEEQIRLIRLPNHINAAITKIKNAREDFYSQTKTYPTDDQIATITGFTIANVKYFTSLEYSVCSLDSPSGDESDGTLLNTIKDNTLLSPVKSLENQEKKETLYSLLEHLSPREKKVIFLRFGLINEQSHNLDECGKILNLTPERVRQIESIALNKIRKMKNCNNLRSMFQNK